MDLAFTDTECLYLLFPFSTNRFIPEMEHLLRHRITPAVSADRVCVRACTAAVVSQADNLVVINKEPVAHEGVITVNTASNSDGPNFEGQVFVNPFLVQTGESGEQSRVPFGPFVDQSDSSNSDSSPLPARVGTDDRFIMPFDPYGLHDHHGHEDYTDHYRNHQGYPMNMTARRGTPDILGRNVETSQRTPVIPSRSGHSQDDSSQAGTNSETGPQTPGRPRHGQDGRFQIGTGSENGPRPQVRPRLGQDDRSQIGTGSETGPKTTVRPRPGQDDRSQVGTGIETRPRTPVRPRHGQDDRSQTGTSNRSGPRTSGRTSPGQTNTFQPRTNHGSVPETPGAPTSHRSNRSQPGTDQATGKSNIDEFPPSHGKRNTLFRKCKRRTPN